MTFPVPEHVAHFPASFTLSDMVAAPSPEQPPQVTYPVPCNTTQILNTYPSFVHPTVARGTSKQPQKWTYHAKWPKDIISYYICHLCCTLKASAHWLQLSFTFKKFVLGRDTDNGSGRSFLTEVLPHSRCIYSWLAGQNCTALPRVVWSRHRRRLHRRMPQWGQLRLIDKVGASWQWSLHTMSLQRLKISEPKEIASRNRKFSYWLFSNASDLAISQLKQPSLAETSKPPGFEKRSTCPACLKPMQPQCSI